MRAQNNLLLAKRFTIRGPRLRGGDIAEFHVARDLPGIAREGITVAAAARGALDHDVAGVQCEAGNLAGKRRGLDLLAIAYDGETIRRAGAAATHAVRRNHVLVRQHRQSRVFCEDAYLAVQPETATMESRAAGILA